MPLQYAANWFYGRVVRSCHNEKQCLVNREETARFLKDDLNGVVFVNLLCHRWASCWIALQANSFDGNDKREKQAYEWRAEDKDRGFIVSELQLWAFKSEPLSVPTNGTHTHISCFCFAFGVCRAQALRVAFQTPRDMNIAFISTPNTDIIYEGNHHQQQWGEPCLPTPSSWPPTVFWSLKLKLFVG